MLLGGLLYCILYRYVLMHTASINFKKPRLSDLVSMCLFVCPCLPPRKESMVLFELGYERSQDMIALCGIHGVSRMMCTKNGSFGYKVTTFGPDECTWIHWLQMGTLFCLLFEEIWYYLILIGNNWVIAYLVLLDQDVDFDQSSTAFSVTESQLRGYVDTSRS